MQSRLLAALISSACIALGCTDSAAGMRPTAPGAGAGTAAGTPSNGGATASGGTATQGGMGGTMGDLATSPVAVTSLVCEYLTNPIAIDVPSPRLSWAMSSAERDQKQTAYQVLATSNGSPLWDSGKLTSTQQTHVPYAGPALTSRQRVEWTVRIWDGQDRASAWSEPGTWRWGCCRPTPGKRNGSPAAPS